MLEVEIPVVFHDMKGIELHVRTMRTIPRVDEFVYLPDESGSRQVRLVHYKFVSQMETVFITLSDQNTMSFIR